MNECKTPNDHSLIIDDFNYMVCKKCGTQWMEVTKLNETNYEVLR